MPPMPEARAITIHVSETVFSGLIAHGRKAGYTPTLYAKLLLEAAYAARCGKGEDDPLLEACVGKSVSRPTVPPPAIAAASPLAKETSAAKWGPASHVTFARLVCREEGASLKEVMAALAPAYQTKKALFVLISHVRKRLEAEGIRLEIVHIWGWRAAPRAAAEALARRLG